MKTILFVFVICVILYFTHEWEVNIKPRIFTNPSEVHFLPEFKLWLRLFFWFLIAAAVLFFVFKAIGPDHSQYLLFIGFACFCLAFFLSRFVTKRILRKDLLRTALSLRMEPEDYAKTLCPNYVLDDILRLGFDEKALKKQIKYHRSRHHISDACAWALLVAYCGKRP